MQRFLSIALALCLGLTLSLDASAGKRMGGGKSFGSTPTHQTRQADAPTSARIRRCRIDGTVKGSKMDVFTCSPGSPIPARSG